MRVHRVWLYASLGAGLKRICSYLSFSLTCVLGLLKSQRPDYVFIESPPLFLGIPGMLYGRMHRAKVLFNVADLWPDSVLEMGIMRDGSLIRMAAALERWVYRKSDFVIAITEGVRETLENRKHVPGSKLLFLPNGVDLDQFAPQSADLALKRELGVDGRKVILYQGTLGYAHGAEEVLKAAELMRADDDIHFLFVGDGSQRKKLEQLKKKLQLRNVSFIDPVPLSELPRFLSIAECGLVSLRRNTSSRVARPAKCNPIFASGKPILFFGEGEGADLVSNARAGLVIAYGDTNRFVEAARYLVRNPDIAHELGLNGRRYAEQHLGWPAMINNWLTELLRCSRARDEPSPVAARVL
jgi:colanic acid biosynthesis glycosyl transferase WcaI